MKKIAYLVYNTNTYLYFRVLPWIRNNPQYHHVIVLDQQTNDPAREAFPLVDRTNISIISIQDFVFDDYAAVLHNRDSQFPIKLRHYAGLVDVTDKAVLEKKLIEFGYARPRTEGFDDNDEVIAKPRRGSSSESSNPICYKNKKFGEIKQYLTDDVIVQDCLTDYKQMAIYVCVGTNGQLYSDLITTLTPVHRGIDQPFRIQGSTIDLVERYPEFKPEVDRLLDFIRFIGYNQISGSVFMVQMLYKDNVFVPIDFNTRPGPIMYGYSNENIYQHHTFKLLPFLTGDQTVEECLQGITEFKAVSVYGEYAELNKTSGPSPTYKRLITRNPHYRSDEKLKFYYVLDGHNLTS